MYAVQGMGSGPDGRIAGSRLVVAAADLKQVRFVDPPSIDPWMELMLVRKTIRRSESLPGMDFYPTREKPGSFPRWRHLPSTNLSYPGRLRSSGIAGH